jgi:hypothetical protein
MPMTRPRSDWETVRAASRRSLNASAIAAETGIPRSTVSMWLRNGFPQRGRRRTTDRGTPSPALWKYAYPYLLGLYLGDGYLGKHRRGVYALHLFLDARYPLITWEAETAVALVNPRGKASVGRSKRDRMCIVTAYSKLWPELFPQHGPGRKHERPIVLEPWQRAICARHPGRLLRGLIHSDGCRSTNTIRNPRKTYSYPRYQLSNRSEDIKRIFCDHCDLLGVEWRVMNAVTISVARRDSVALLDRHVGPKR